MAPEPVRSRHSSDSYRLALTPAGAGVLGLFFPGIVIAAVSQQQPLIAICVGAGLILALNAALARIAAWRIEIGLRVRTTATAGSVVPATVTLGGRGAVECAVGIERGVRSWTAAVTPTRGDLGFRVERRGVVDALCVRVQTAVPFGLTAFIRHSTITLDESLHVGPLPVAVDARPAMFSSEGGDGRHAATDEETIGLREYSMGDSQRDIHWPTVARTGELMVRDRRRSGLREKVAVLVAVQGETELVDKGLGRAMTVVGGLLNDGYPVVLTTTERRPDPKLRPRAKPARARPRDLARRDLAPRVEVTAAVVGRDQLIERLARACAPAPGPLSTGRSEAHLLVTEKGVSWHSPS